ncbi:olfactory receptor 2G3-like [Rhinatrema bivittatum]|uniref:olfactory receptor 2G3-like n=1 Tax=Rhinatrema bivittatum TaxID=194408 RepID=UPI0011297945|nr:olfactory receptor 2G3-like [Rhinatrema bivittatum]
MYLVAVSANMLILVAVWVNKHLHTPMYFFLTNLSFLDICYISSHLPNSLKEVFSERKVISFAGCAAEMYIALALGETQCLLLAVMACDRYVAICHPLNYVTIMNRPLCMKMAISTWISGFVLSVVHVAFTLTLPFCGRNRINHVACEIEAVLRLACTDIHLNEMVIFAVGVVILIIPLSFVLFTYVHIIAAILKISSSRGRHKAFSTCTSHLMVVTMFYGTCMVMYMTPRSLVSEDKHKIISMFYGALIPMLNPLIYTLRNNDVKEALRKTIRVNIGSPNK